VVFIVFLVYILVFLSSFGVFREKAIKKEYCCEFLAVYTSALYKKIDIDLITSNMRK
jgi:hypothetical protein